MILDRLKSFDPRLWFRPKAKEPSAEKPEPELLIEDEAVHPDDDKTLKLIAEAVRLAFVGCYAFMVLFCLQFVGKVKFDIDFGLTSGKPFHFTYDIGSILNLLPLFAVFVVSYGILVYAKSWVNYFAEEDHRVAKWLAFAFGICSVGVVVLGSLSVNQEARQEDYRAGLIAEEQVDNHAAGRQAMIEAKKEKLASMKSGETWEAKAAREGWVGWSEKIVLAKAQLVKGEITQERYNRIERAGTTAKAADALDSEILRDIGAAASAGTKAEVRADVGTAMHDPVTAFVRSTTPWRMPLMCFTMDMILIFGLFLGDIRRKRLLAEWNAYVLRRKANAATESASATQGTEKPQGEANPSATETGDPDAGSEAKGASANTEAGAEAPNPSSGVEEKTRRKTTEVETHTRRVYQRKGRPATLAELKAAGLYTEEPANDAEPQGSAEQPETSERVEAPGMDQGSAGADSISPVSEVAVDGNQDRVLNDEQPQVELEPEAPEGEQQGTETQTGADGSNPSQGNENEEAA